MVIKVFIYWYMKEIMKEPNILRFKGKLGLDKENRQVTLDSPLETPWTTTKEIYTIPMHELLEEMLGKDVEIKIYRTENGKKVVDSQVTADINVERIKNSRLLRESLLQDKFRPGYHFAILDDVGRPGDPNGAFFGNDGRYHLMYLYNRRGVGFSWGHISSLDLVHWRHHPDALLPNEKIQGCFSGGAFLDDDGTAYLSYWIVDEHKGERAQNGIVIAKSTDYHYERWENLPNIAIAAEKMGITEMVEKNGKKKLLANADPSNIWKKDGVYYMQTGNLPLLNEHGRDPNDPLYEKMRGDWVDLFRSRDLQKWEYMHRFYDYQDRKGWTDGTEDDMCPSFLPLPLSPDGGKMSDKYLQLFISHNKGCQYYIGSYDKDQDKFIPETHGRMTWTDNTYFAPEALIDKKGRQIMWAWLLDNPDSTEQWVLRRGWCGVYGLPRLLWLGENGDLKERVPPEFNILRHNEKKWENFTLSPSVENKKELKGIRGGSCEILLKVPPKEVGKVGLIVKASPDGKEKTLLYFNSKEELLVFDSRKSSLDKIGRPVKEKAPINFEKKDKILEFRVFIDKSVVEVSLNDSQIICRRVFPTLDDADHVFLFCEGEAITIKELKVWEMMPSNPF